MADGYGKRVLVAVGDDTDKHSLTRILTHANYNVHLASDGLHALEEMKKRRFDVVVTDYHLPRMSGRELLLLSKVVWPNTPVIVLSCDGNDLADNIIDLGAFASVRKPYEPQLLLEQLQSATQRRPGDTWEQLVLRTAG